MLLLREWEDTNYLKCVANSSNGSVFSSDLILCFKIYGTSVCAHWGIRLLGFI